MRLLAAVMSLLLVRTAVILPETSFQNILYTQKIKVKEKLEVKRPFLRANNRAQAGHSKTRRLFPSEISSLVKASS